MLDLEEYSYLEIIKKYFTKDIVLFDVGLRDGQYTDLFLEKFKGCNIIVHSFEPNENNYETLNKKFSNNKNIIFNKIALDNENSTKKFYVIDSNLELSGLSSLHYRKNVFKKFTIKEINVNTKILDDYCVENKIDRIDFLKIDVEGNELNIIKGSKQLLQNKKIDFIQFEYGLCWEDAKATIKECLEFLHSYGYKVYSHFNKLEEVTSLEDGYKDLKCTNYLATYKVL